MQGLIILVVIIIVLFLLFYFRERRERRKVAEVYTKYLNGDTFVCIDLETTGLRAGPDRITEIAAIKFNKDIIFQEFSSLINPERYIPRIVQEMTGITAEMVKDAPEFESIRGDLQVFLGDFPLLGYNIDFDISFLRVQGLKLANSTFDVLSLARRCIPTRRSSGRRQRYKLGSIARYLGIGVSHSHRALGDAHTTIEVFKRLKETEYVIKIILHVLA